jgi:hypothetical protein
MSVMGILRQLGGRTCYRRHFEHPNCSITILDEGYFGCRNLCGQTRLCWYVLWRLPLFLRFDLGSFSFRIRL